jgi:hypothetical protein
MLAGAFMKRLLFCGGLALVGLISVGFALSAQTTTPEPAAEPWQVGRCYRVFPENRDQLYIFKVAAPPIGPWIRVETDPAATRVPGARPQSPLWLNANTLFAVQEWTCSA